MYAAISLVDVEANFLFVKAYQSTTLTSIQVCMYACMYVCMYICIDGCMYACMYVCMYVCMCMYICMYVCKSFHLLEFFFADSRLFFHPGRHYFGTVVPWNTIFV